MIRSRVLIVEDESDIRRFVRMALEQEGLDTCEASTAREARMYASSSKPDLVIVDLGLPDDDGGWRYAGRVGSGLAGSAGAALLRRLRPAERATSPFADEVPRIDASGTTWVEPRLVVEVRTLMLTADHRLRQPT